MTGKSVSRDVGGTRRINVIEARRFASQVLLSAGLGAAEAASAAEALVWTSLRGIDTHGLRLLPTYVDELSSGRANAHPQMVCRETATSVATLDADDALGIISGQFGADKAAALAAQHGVGVVSVSNSNHFGAASVFGYRLAQHGLLGIVTTSAASRVAACGSGQAFLGTNPICICAPAIGGETFCLDMATSQLSFGRLKALSQSGRPLPDYGAVDRNGEPTSKLKELSALAPLGGYKGQGLAMAMSVLTALLAGMPSDPDLIDFGSAEPAQGRSIAHFILALDPGVFPGGEVFNQALAELMEGVRATGYGVLSPGDPEQRAEEERRVKGIPLDTCDYEALSTLATNRGLHLEVSAVVR